jgi:hypothetical protein
VFLPQRADEQLEDRHLAKIFTTAVFQEERPAGEGLSQQCNQGIERCITAFLDRVNAGNVVVRVVRVPEGLGNGTLIGSPTEGPS